MEFTTRDSIIEVLDLLYAKSGMKPTEKTKMLNLKVWCIALEDINDKTIDEGFKKASRIKGYMMDSGDFYQLCISSGEVSTIEEEASQAWTEAFSNLNSWITPIFKNTVTSETIRQMGGWINFCSMLQTEEPFRKKEFSGIYSTMKKTGTEFVSQLKGSYEQKKFIGFSSKEEEKEFEKKLIAEEETVKKIAGL